jgi:phosphoglycolate phosphatase
MPRTLFAFDWSGTLSDDRPPVYQTNERIRADYGLPSVSYEDWLLHSVGNVVDYFQQQDPTLAAERILADFKKHFAQVEADGTVPHMYEAVPGLLRTLRDENKIIGVISAHPQINLEAEAERYGIRDLFDFMIGSCHAKDEALRDIAGIYVQDPRIEAYYTGDTTHDMQHGKLAGYATIAIGTGYHSESQLRSVNPDHYIGTHEAFYPLIRC